MTNHMWSGFNQMAHLGTWRGLPDDIKDAITRNVTKYVRQQRIDQGNVNAGLRDKFIAAGLIFNEVDQSPFRAKLANVYATWKDRLGSKCWTLLEAEVGKLGKCRAPLEATVFGGAMRGRPREGHCRSRISLRFTRAASSVLLFALTIHNSGAAEADCRELDRNYTAAKADLTSIQLNAMLFASAAKDCAALARRLIVAGP